MSPTSISCPRCTSKDLRLSHRSGFDWFMSKIGLRPVRCLACGKRFYMRRPPAKSEKG
jgi:hypothetical protein